MNCDWIPCRSSFPQLLVFHHFSIVLKLFEKKPQHTHKPPPPKQQQKNPNKPLSLGNTSSTVKEMCCSFMVGRLFFYLSYDIIILLSFLSSFSQPGQDCSLRHKFLCSATKALNEVRKRDLGAEMRARRAAFSPLDC